jgi:hypothetical protein
MDMVVKRFGEINKDFPEEVEDATINFYRHRCNKGFKK